LQIEQWANELTFEQGGKVSVQGQKASTSVTFPDTRRWVHQVWVWRLSNLTEKWTRALHPETLKPEPDLWVSDQGRLKRNSREVIVKGGHKRNYQERTSEGTVNNQGYSLSFDRLVHRWVYISFRKEQVKTPYIVNHKNGDRSDNRLINLEKITYSENNSSSKKRHAPSATAKKWRGFLPVNRMRGERWKEVPGRENYAVSNLGRVKNLNKTRKYSHGEHLIRLTPVGLKSGKTYSQVTLYESGVRFKANVHQTVWSAFRGDIPEGYVIHHKNNNGEDNRLCNLDCVTRAQNTQAAVDDGVFGKRSLKERAALDNALVAGETVDHLEKTMGFSRSHILKKKRELGLTSRRYFPADKKAKAEKMLKAEKDYGQVEKATGLERKYLRSLKHKIGVSKSRLIPEKTKERIEHDLRHSDLSQKDIAKKHGVSKFLVYKINQEKSIRKN
jgi:hypothetical protein